MDRLTPFQFTLLCESCPTCKVEESYGTKYYTFEGKEEETIHITTGFKVNPFQNVIVEFNGKTGQIEQPEGYVDVTFLTANDQPIGQMYKGRVLGVSRCGYHRYGYIAPKGAVYVKFRVITALGTTITLSDLTVSCLDVAPKRGRNGMLLDGHLGMLLSAPRNVMTSFEMVKRSGFDTMITNVNATKDGKLVALHNDTIDATSNGTGPVADYTFEELKQFDFGSWFHENYSGEQIPLLEDVARFASVSGIHILFRMHKEWANPEHDHYTNEIYSYIKKYGMVGKASLKSFSHEHIDYYHKIFGNDVSYIFCSRTLPTDEQIEWAANFDGDITLEPKQTVVTEEFCQKCIASGVKMSSYIVNDMAMMRKLFLMGITRFCTDTYSDIVFPLD